jgi:formylglycine-generating enzyme required for sulfatase activity
MPEIVFPGDDLPRSNVSWYDVVAFCRWLSNKLGYTVTLPTEQQWQRAAQGDDEREYPWGDDFDHSRCNIASKSTTPVTQYPNGASPFGVMDMAGNVAEWCLTKWGEFRKDSNNLDGEEERVLRGYPHYGDRYQDASVKYRVHYLPSEENNGNGFRLVTHFQ